MHEWPKFEKKNSAEQPYLIEKLDPEMRAAKFVLDPQEYINQYHDYLQSVHSNESDYAVLAISEIYELESVVLHSDYTELHPDLESFLATGDEFTSNSNKVLLTWLKQAGYTKEQILTWIEIEQDDLSAVEQLQDRGIRVILNQVFSE